MADRLEPITEWLGRVPITHGERYDSSACLCGHPDYLECPDWLAGAGTIAGLVISRSEARDG